MEDSPSYPYRFYLKIKCMKIVVFESAFGRIISLSIDISLSLSITVLKRYFYLNATSSGSINTFKKRLIYN